MSLILDEPESRNDLLDSEEQLLIKGDDIQKLSVLGSLPELLRYDKHGTVSKIMPKIQQELPNSSIEFNLAASKIFNILIHMDIPLNLVPQILQGIDSKDQVIANSWMETFLDVIPVLKDHIVKNEVLKCAISKSQLAKAAYFRVSSCKLLGRIAVHRAMSPFDVKKDILPLVQSLCQDCYQEVRAAMCRELPNIAQGLYHLGDTIIKVNILPLLVEMSSDENVSVRSAAVDAVVLIIPFLTPETVKTTLIPLTKKICTRSVAEGDTTYTSIATSFSKLIQFLQPQLSVNDTTWFLDYYIHICKRGLSLADDLDVEPAVNMLCRQHCALSLSVVASVVLAIIPGEINGKWYHTFKELAADPCYLVRKAVAKSFAEIIDVLDAGNKVAVLDFTKLLRDDDEEVLQALVPNIGSVLERFAVSGVLTKELPVQATLDIGRALLKCYNEVFKTKNWRLKESMLKQFEQLPLAMPSDFIHQHFTQIVLNATLNGKAKPVRSQATRTLLICLRYNLKENHRKWIRECILNQLCNSNCCYTRQTYVQLCCHAVNIFSWRYFKEFFYLPLLGLAEDPVSIVRLSVVKLCPVLKHMLVLPSDKALQLKLESILSKMEVMESDADVIKTLRAKLKEMRSLLVNKIDLMCEEKSKLEEEERISKGKLPFKLLAISVKADLPNTKQVKETVKKSSSMSVSRQGSRTKRPISGGSISSMSFLDHHFYIDAGVSLPQALHLDFDYPLPTNDSVVHNLPWFGNQVTTQASDLLKSCSLQENTTNDSSSKTNQNELIISVENLNIESLSEKELKVLETTTTNITDDVKVNIKKITKHGQLKNKTKRYSCVFSNEVNKCEEKKKNEAAFKRRSLNIALANDSRIPVCTRMNKISIDQKFKSVSDQNLDKNPKNDERVGGLPKLNNQFQRKRSEGSINDEQFSLISKTISTIPDHKLVNAGDNRIVHKANTSKVTSNTMVGKINEKKLSYSTIVHNSHKLSTVAHNINTDKISGRIIIDKSDVSNVGNFFINNNRISDQKNTDDKTDITKLNTRHNKTFETPVSENSFKKDIEVREVKRKSSGLPISVSRKLAK